MEDRLNKIRELARQHMAKEGLSQAAIAKRAGMAAATFSAWLNDSYAGNNAKIADDVETYLKAQTARAQMVVVPKLPFTSTPSAKRMMTMLEHAQFLPDIVVIAAGAGVGKTTTIKHYRDTHPNVYLLTGSPSVTKARHLLEYLAEMLAVSETTPHRIARAVANKLRDTGALLIVDEAQFLAPGGVEQLRSLYDSAEIGVALVGNEEVWSKLDGGGRKAVFAQVFSRIGMNLTIPRPTDSDINAILDGNSIEDMEQRQLLRRIASKPGALRGLEKTLRVARMLAVGGAAELNREHIRAAWSRVSNQRDLD
jgi:DNA transposition AAA+ family ATPase